MLRRWATPLVLVLLVVLLAFGSWWGWRALTRPLNEITSTPCVTQTVAGTLKSSQVSVQVFNGGSVAGRANSVADSLKAKGFKIIRTGNTSQQAPVTTIVGHAADDPEVKMVAAFFPKSEIKADGRADHTVDVLLTDQFDGINDQAPTEVPVPGGTVCLPASGAPAPASPSS